MPISVDEACLISVILEGVVYAISIIVLAIIAWTLIFKQRGKPLILVAVSGTLFVLSTVHLILNAIHVDACYKSSTSLRDTSRCNSVFSHRIYTAKYAIYIVQTCTADGFMVWRSYILSGAYIAAIPAFLCIATFVVGVAGTSFLSKADTDFASIFSSSYSPWMISFYALTLSSHFSNTTILVLRIWSAFHNTTFEKTRSLCIQIIWKLLITHIVFAATIMAVLVCFLCGTVGQLIVADIVVPIISLAHYCAIPRRQQVKIVSSKDVITHVAHMDEKKDADKAHDYHTMSVVSYYNHMDNTVSMYGGLTQEGSDEV